MKSLVLKVKQFVKNLFTEPNNSLMEENLKLHRKIDMLETYNMALLSRLKIVCFGSTLPRIMKQVALQYYTHSLNPIKLEWGKDASNTLVVRVCNE